MKPGIIFDRDGVIVPHYHLLADIKLCELVPGAVEAIMMLNGLGYATAVATNQGGIIARGLATVQEVEKINQCMVDQLSRAGAYINAIYYCPHHPNPDGNPEQFNREFIRECSCRKPAAGMILKAVNMLQIDPQRCVVIGDTTSDWAAAQQAGVLFMPVKTYYHELNPQFLRPEVTGFGKMGVWANVLSAVQGAVSLLGES